MSSRFVWRFILSAVGAICVGFILRLCWSLFLPAVSWPTIIDLGWQENGNRVLVPFSIVNKGGKLLRLRHYASSCTCLTVVDAEQRQLGEETLILPYSSIAFQASVLIRATPGVVLQESISFQTNDPAAKEIGVRFRASVEGSISPTLSVINLGKMLPNQSQHRSVQFRNTGRIRPYQMPVVSSTIADIVRVDVVKGVDRVVDKLVTSADTPIVYEATLSVKAPSVPQRVLGALIVTELNQRLPTVTIPICGEVVSRFNLSSSGLVLPRRSGRHLHYSTTIYCRAVDGTSLLLSAASVPAGVKIAVREGATSSELCVMVDASSIDVSRESTHAIVIRATSQSGSELITVPLFIANPIVAGSFMPYAP